MYRYKEIKTLIFNTLTYIYTHRIHLREKSEKKKSNTFFGFAKQIFRKVMLHFASINLPFGEN
jgi:hypothetical protein